jgi:toxin FitB
VIILDTNVVSELLRPRPSLVVARWVDAQARPFITAITIQESFYGIELLTSELRGRELTARLEVILDSVFHARILPYSAIAARHTAVVIAHRRRLGRPISTADAQIAGIALEHRATLVTRNTRDFVGMRLDLANPWDE